MIRLCVCVKVISGQLSEEVVSILDNGMEGNLHVQRWILFVSLEEVESYPVELITSVAFAIIHELGSTIIILLLFESTKHILVILVIVLLNLLKRYESLILIDDLNVVIGVFTNQVSHRRNLMILGVDDIWIGVMALYD